MNQRIKTALRWQPIKWLPSEWPNGEQMLLVSPDQESVQAYSQKDFNPEKIRFEAAADRFGRRFLFAFVDLPSEFDRAINAQSENHK